MLDFFVLTFASILCHLLRFCSQHRRNILLEREKRASWFFASPWAVHVITFFGYSIQTNVLNVWNFRCHLGAKQKPKQNASICHCNRSHRSDLSTHIGKTLICAQFAFTLFEAPKKWNNTTATTFQTTRCYLVLWSRRAGGVSSANFVFRFLTWCVCGRYFVQKSRGHAE